MRLAMYICVCNAVTERDIHEAVCEGACSMRDLRQQLGVASQCGRCATCAKAVLDQEMHHAKAMHYPVHQYPHSTLKQVV